MTIPITISLIIIFYIIFRNKKNRKKDFVFATFHVQIVFYKDKKNALLKATNELRMLDGSVPLISGKIITEKAEMRNNERIEHYKKTGKADSHKGFQKVAYNLQKKNIKKVGENLGFGYSSVVGVMKGWVNSKSHLINMLNPLYDTIGLSIKTYNGRWFWLSLFIDSDGKKIEIKNN